MSLPYAFSQCGLVWGVIFVAIGAALTLWSLRMLIESAHLNDTLNYMKLCEKSVGNWLGVVLEIGMILCLFGLITLFQIMCIFNN